MSPECVLTNPEISRLWEHRS